MYQKYLIMKKLYLSVPLILFLILISFENSNSKIVEYHQKELLRSTGLITSMTGAPGESNCTSCHSGNTNDGNNGMSELQITSQATNEYTPGETLTMEFELTDPSTKNGFQLVALNSNNEMAGSFTITDSGATQLRENQNLGRSYVTHVSGGTSNSSWTFDWETPETGGEVTFYVAANKSANNNSSSGDQIYLSQHTFTADDLANTTEQEKQIFDFDVFYQKQNQRLKLELNKLNQEEMFFNLIDLQGKSIHSQQLDQTNGDEVTEYIHLGKELESGIYVVTIFSYNTPVSKKIFVD